jgi:hypothetical protein
LRAVGRHGNILLRTWRGAAGRGIPGYNPRSGRSGKSPVNFATTILVFGARSMKSAPSHSVKEISDNRRRFERVDVTFTAQVFVTDDKDRRIGILRQVGRGGFMIEPEREFKVGKKLKLFIVDRSENIRRAVKVVVRYAEVQRVGFEFEKLDIDTAIEVGVLIGKYYQSDAVIA